MVNAEAIANVLLKERVVINATGTKNTIRVMVVVEGLKKMDMGDVVNALMVFSMMLGT